MASGIRRVLHHRLSLTLGTVVSVVVLDLLLVVACLLALQRNVQLRRGVTNYLTLLLPMKGTYAPALAGSNWAGASQMIGYEEERRPTLVYTFTEHCGHCQENWQMMRSFQALGSDRLRIAYVDTADKLTAQYLTEHRIAQSTLFRWLTPESAFAYQARIVPQAELLDGSGRVRWAHAGELSAQDVSEALSMIR